MVFYFIIYKYGKNTLCIFQIASYCAPQYRLQTTMSENQTTLSKSKINQLNAVGTVEGKTMGKSRTDIYNKIINTFQLILAISKL